MAIYAYRCPEGHVTEHQAPMGSKKPQWLPCGQCSAHAQRLVSFPKNLFFRGPGFTRGGYDYVEEMVTGRDFEAERKRKEYETTKDDLDIALDQQGLNVFEDTLPFTRSTDAD